MTHSLPRAVGLWLGYALLHAVAALLLVAVLVLALAAFDAAPNRWPLLIAAAPPAAGLTALVPLRRALRAR